VKQERKNDAVDKLKAQLAQINALIADGTLKGDVAKQRRDELEHQILAAVTGAEANPTAADAAPRAPRGLVAGIAVFVLAFGLAGYAWLGNRNAMGVGPGESGEAAAAAATDPAGQQAQIEAMIGKLEDKLKTKPDDAEGWQMLARSYGVLGRYPEAVAAHKRVVALKPKDAQVLADYADALAMANGKTLMGEPEQIIAQAVKLDPNNVKALALAGTVAFNRNDFTAAVAHWEHAVAIAGTDSAYAQQLQGAVAEARQRAGMPAASAASGASGASVSAGTSAGTSTSTSTKAAISGRVSLSAKAQSQAGPDDTVFIFARAPTGSRMPLAIVRKKVSELPYEFTLDDSLAMSPAARLSGAQQVVVGARISKTGNAMPNPGDWQVLSAPMAVGASGVKLEISEQVQ